MVNKSSNTYHTTIKMKHVDMKSSTYIVQHKLEMFVNLKVKGEEMLERFTKMNWQKAREKMIKFMSD